MGCRDFFPNEKVRPAARREKTDGEDGCEEGSGEPWYIFG